MAVSDWRYDYRPSIDRDTEEETLRQWRRTGSMLAGEKGKRRTITWIVATLLAAGALAAFAWL